LYKERTGLFSNQRRFKNGANIELSSVSKNYFIKQRNASDLNSLFTKYIHPLFICKLLVTTLRKFQGNL
jgi:hypothetical protein